MRHLRTGVRPLSIDDERGGFTLTEAVLVLTLVIVTLAIASSLYGDYIERTAARGVAGVFAQDLVSARSVALRNRETVVVRFDEANRYYTIATTNGTEVVARRYGDGADIRLAAMDLALPGDTMVFNSRGVADLSGAGGPLGEATFQSGPIAYAVSFNSMGASRVERQ